MNGRVYDYNLGRFLSVDPFVHGGSQGINPYSYIMNNPLAGTDPTGYKPEEVEIKVRHKPITGSRIGRTETVTASVSVSDGTATIDLNGGSAAAQTAVAGAIASAVSSGSVQSQSVSSQSTSGSTTDINNETKKSKAPSSSGSFGETVKGVATEAAKSLKRGGAIGLAIAPTMMGNSELSEDELAHAHLNGLINQAEKNGEDSITLFRTASPAESADIRSTGVFRPGPNNFVKQFTLTPQDAFDFQEALPSLGSQRSNPDFALPHTVFAARISLKTARTLTPTYITDHGRQSLILSAYDRRALGRINTDALARGGIRELGTK